MDVNFETENWGNCFTDENFIQSLSDFLFFADKKDGF